MVYSSKIPECYPNKFIIGPYEYDKIQHKTLINDDPKEIEDEDLNVPFNYNEVYDVHYFLTSLLDLYISQELFDWIVDLYPRDLIPDEESSSTSYSSEYSSSSTNDSTSSKSASKSDNLNEKLKNLSISVSSTDNSDNSSTDNSSIDNSDNSSAGDSDNSDNSNPPKYLSEGRLINGTEDVFKLPSPLDLIRNKFFDNLTIKPADFDESKALYFKAGF
jgi:hypothetical protein